MATISTAVLIHPRDIDAVKANVHGPAEHPIASIQIETDTHVADIHTSHDTGPEDLIQFLDNALDRLHRAYNRWAEISAPSGEPEGSGASDAGREAPANAPAPLTALIAAIDVEYMASCLAQDGRSEGTVAVDVITNPANRDLVLAVIGSAS